MPEILQKMPWYSAWGVPGPMWGSTQGSKARHFGQHCLRRSMNDRCMLYQCCVRLQNSYMWRKCLICQRWCILTIQISQCRYYNCLKKYYLINNSTKRWVFLVTVEEKPYKYFIFTVSEQKVLIEVFRKAIEPLVIWRWLKVLQTIKIGKNYYEYFFLGSREEN